MLAGMLDPQVIVATLVGGAFAGVYGARRNGVRFEDERTLWAVGGAIGASVALALGVWLLGTPRAVLAAAAWLVLSLLASTWLPRLDDSGRTSASVASFVVKLLQSPVLTGLGSLAAVVRAMRGRPVALARGTLFADGGPGDAAVTLGAVVWIRRGLRTDEGRVADRWARHEAFHTRAVAALGESGFYLTYLLIGAPLALLRGAPWNALDRAGVGQPFERTAYALDHDEPPPPALDDLRSPTA